MTTSEFSVEFDLLYNNALSNSAPPINEYEKSLFLTQAQEEIVKQAYDPENKNIDPLIEKLRRVLEGVLKVSTSQYDSILNTYLSDYKIDSKSRFFEIADNVWYLMYEAAKTATSELWVDPVTEDQYFYLSGNPFKQPNKNKVFRMDLSKTIADKRVVEIISTEAITSYYYRYVEQPTPIILINLTGGEFDGYLIRGLGVTTECNLSPSVHETILKRAVELATTAYKENSLQNNVQLNNRSF